MRQAGILAAAGKYALEHNVDRLADDHRRAKEIATVVAERAPHVVDPDLVETNIVVLDVTKCRRGATEVAAGAAERGVLMNVVSPTTVRLVTHLDVDDADCERAADVVADLVAR
jgi:threonine aldolase